MKGNMCGATALTWHGACLLVLAGCGDQTSAVRTADIEAGGDIAALISDAARDANGIGGFYFRPPIVAQVPYPGAFDPTLSPEVVVCEWTGECAAEVARFDLSSGTGGEVIHVEVDHYHVDWHTDLSALDPAKTYRILVNVSGLPLGFADVDVVSKGSELRNVHTQEYIPLLNGRTLPIKFRAELGIAGRITIDPPEMFMEVGDAQPVTATVFDLHDAPLPYAVPAWALAFTSGEGERASFETGTLSAVSPSTGTLTASYAGRSATAAFTIFDPPVALEFATSCGSLRIGVPATLTATAYDAAEEPRNPITRPSLRIRYASSHENILLVNQSSGELTGLARGVAAVTASVMSLTASTRLLVYGEADVISIAPTSDAQATSLTLDPEEAADLAGTFSGEEITAATYGGCRVWSSDHPDIVSVSDDGHITATGAGETTIRLAIGDLRGSFPVMVELPPPPPDEPPTGDPGPDCDADGCVVHLAEWASSRAMDVNVRGEMVIWVVVKVGTANRNRAYFWDGNIDHPPVLLDHSDAVHCTPYAINNHGAIVGSCTWPLGSTKHGAVYWASHGAAIQVLPTIANPPEMLIGTSARDINDAGVIVGHAPRSYIHPGTNWVTWAPAAAKWDSHTATPVTFQWSSNWIGPTGFLWGISQSGRMSGQSSVIRVASTGVRVDVPHAGVVVNGFVADLGADFISPNNDGQSMAFKINDAGTAVGWTDASIAPNTSPRHRALRWPNGGTRTTIPGVPGVTLAASEAADVNEAGWVVGAWGTGVAGSNIVSNAFLWKGNTAVPAMALPRPTNILGARANAVSQVFDGPNGEKHAYAGGHLITNSSVNLRAVRWLVKQTAAEVVMP